MPIPYEKNSTGAPRKIIHIDMDAFFASVEQRDHPELRGKPIAVGSKAKRGVVAAASYEARKYGVRSAMPSMTAARLCPQLIFVKHRFEVYKEVSQQIRTIFEEYTDLIEPLSLDEAFLDVSHNKKNMLSATLIAEEIRQRIFEKTQLTASAGVSFNKFLAKIASDINKPNGLKVITPEEAIPFLEQLPIEKFFGIGKVTAKRMKGMGIHTGADLKTFSELELAQRFGKAGRYYFRIVRAQDDRKVNPYRIRKSIGAERTFQEDIADIRLMEEKITYIANIVFDYMKQKGNFGRTISLKFKTPDFQIFTRSKSFSSEIKNHELFLNIIKEILAENVKSIPVVRLLGVTVSNLQKETKGGYQLSFDFDQGTWDPDYSTD
ncbi:MAG TPA: DNA polymerase IV [Phaeodactylibacter sp.]|nr:DNA polymerase IV [Phaeodactylibacter sp.]